MHAIRQGRRPHDRPRLTPHTDSTAHRRTRRRGEYSPAERLFPMPWRPWQRRQWRLPTAIPAGCRPPRARPVASPPALQEAIPSQVARARGWSPARRRDLHRHRRGARLRGQPRRIRPIRRIPRAETRENDRDGRGEPTPTSTPLSGTLLAPQPPMQKSVKCASLATLLAVASVASAQPATGHAPAGWDAGVKLAEAPDRNPDPGVVEVDLTARIAEVEIAPGTRVRAWTYNGGLPGPLIRAKVGDRLIVHFTNELPSRRPSTGTACACRSRWTACPASRSPRSRRASVHLRLRPSATRALLVSPARDVGGTGRLRPLRRAAGRGSGRRRRRRRPADAGAERHRLRRRAARSNPPTAAARPAWCSAARARTCWSTAGCTPTLRARAGAPQRWRIVNAAKSRFFYLDLDGQPFTVIGSDGGLQERPVDRRTILLVTPANGST